MQALGFGVGVQLVKETGLQSAEGICKQGRSLGLGIAHAQNGRVVFRTLGQQLGKLGGSGHQLGLILGSAHHNAAGVFHILHFKAGAHQGGADKNAVAQQMYAHVVGEAQRHGGLNGNIGGGGGLAHLGQSFFNGGRVVVLFQLAEFGFVGNQHILGIGAIGGVHGNGHGVVLAQHGSGRRTGGAVAQNGDFAVHG